MPQVIISYQNQKTLKALKDFSKYLDFVIEKPKEKMKVKTKAENIISGNPKIDISDLTAIFSNKNLDAAKLRIELWQRK